MSRRCCRHRAESKPAFAHLRPQTTSGSYLALRTDNSVVSYDETEVSRFKKYYAAGGVRACPESGRRVAMWEPETVFFLLSDQLGSTATVADGNGNETGKLLYKPWGETRYSSGSTPKPGNPGSLNRYSYALNNALRYTDPTGMFTEEEIMNYLGVKTWEEVLKMFGKRGLYEGQWGWLEVLHTAEIGDSVFFMPETGNPWQAADSASFAGAFADVNGQLTLVNSQGVSVDPASVLRAAKHEAYVITRPGSEEYGPVAGAPDQGLLRYIEDKQYQHLHVYPQNLHTDFISLWHYTELIGVGVANISLGFGMIGLGEGLCTTGVGCVAGGILAVSGVGVIGSGGAMFYGLKVELEHQHVYERRP